MAPLARWMFVFALVFCCASRAEAQTGLGGGQTGLGGGAPSWPASYIALVAEGPAPKSEPIDNFNYEDLEHLITSSGAVRIEEVLPKLPVELREGPILMSKSRSTHQATTNYPRVILCSPKAHFMLAYSTSSEDANRHLLEVIQWRSEDDTFEFREIAFDPKAKKPPEFSEANPSRCTACHGDSLRPNWEPASIWPGAVGSGRHLEWNEHQRLRDYSLRSDPRLKAIHWKVPNHGAETPAARMATHLNALNTRRMTRFIRESPDYDLYKYSIVAGLLSLPGFQQIEPIRTASFERPNDYKDLLKETRSTLTELLAKYYGPDEAAAIANVRLIFEPRSISLRDVSTSSRSHFMLTGDMHTDFGAVVKQLYEEDEQLRTAAPLPSNIIQAFQGGEPRAALENQLASAAKQAWSERTKLVAARPAQW